MDRATKFSEAFRVTLGQVAIEAVRLPPRSPDLNPNIERSMRSLREACVERMPFFGERSMPVAAAELLSHYHAERNHQGLDNRLIEPGEEVGRSAWLGMFLHPCSKLSIDFAGVANNCPSRVASL